MSSAAIRHRLTAEDYLDYERDSPTKHEFYDGEIFAMAGGSSAHNIITLNVGSELRSALRSRDCITYPSDMRVLCPTGLRTYPDCSVVCGPPDLEMIRGTETLRNPVVLVEILSPSTEAFDRGNKFAHYRTIRSLRGYLLVSQDCADLHYFSLREGIGWMLTDAAGVASSIDIYDLGLRLSLADVYAKVDLPPLEPLLQDPPPAAPVDPRPPGPHLLNN